MGIEYKDGKAYFVAGDKSKFTPTTTRVTLPSSNWFNTLNSSFFDNFQASGIDTSLAETNPMEYWGVNDPSKWTGIDPTEAQVDQAISEFNQKSPVTYNPADKTLSGTSANIDLFKADTGQKNGSMLDDMTMGDWMKTAAAGAGAIKDLYGIYQGEKMYDLAKDQFAFDRKLTKTNLFNQAQTVNADMASRQRAANAVGVGSSVSDYMDQYGVKGRM